MQCRSGTAPSAPDCMQRRSAQAVRRPKRRRERILSNAAVCAMPGAATSAFTREPEACSQWSGKASPWGGAPPSRQGRWAGEGGGCLQPRVEPCCEEHVGQFALVIALPRPAAADELVRVPALRARELSGGAAHSACTAVDAARRQACEPGAPRRR